MKFFDSEKIFEINDNIEIKVYTLENNVKVVEIENFYKYPELVETLARETPLSTTTTIFKSGFPGYRSQLEMANQNKQFFKKLTDILYEPFNLGAILHDDEILVTQNRSVTFNVFTKNVNKTNPIRRHHPHWDLALISALVYLSKDINQGTSICYHNDSKLSHFPSTEGQAILMSQQLNKPVDELMKTVIEWTDTLQNAGYIENEKLTVGNSDQYTENFISSGKYNTFVAFLGSTLHSPIVDYDELKEKNTTRINQVMFLDAAKRRF